MSQYPMKDVIVLLPGITGSVLEKDGKVVWGWSARSLGTALLTGGKSMRDKLMLGGDDPDVDDLGDGVTASRLIPDLHLIPGVWKIDGYSKVSDRIRERFDVTPGENYFEFPYDWRRTNVVAARKLARDTHRWLGAWREKTNNPDAKLVLVAHSMGGLVSRHFLEILDGWRDTRVLVTFGAPYRGSLNALDSLANGVRKGPLGLIDVTELCRSLTALYELLPIYPAYDSGDGELVRIGETSGIPYVDPARAAEALAFHRAIEDAVDAHLAEDDYRAGRYQLHPVVGIRQKTNQSAVRSGDGVQMLSTYEGEDMWGDGTVPRVSAVPIEDNGRNVGTYASTKHGSLQNGEDALIQLEGLLSAMALDLGSFRRDPADRSVALEIDDLFFDIESVLVRATPFRPGVPLAATVWDSTSGAEIRRHALEPDGDAQVADLGKLPQGNYRVEVAGEGLRTVEDSFVVGPGGGA